MKLEKRPTNKFKLVYDEEYDNLFIYDKVKRASYGIEWGDLDLSYDKSGVLANMNLSNASQFPGNLTKARITKEDLQAIHDCKINLNEKAGILHVNFKLYFKDKNREPIEDTLTVKALNYNSPVTA